MAAAAAAALLLLAGSALANQSYTDSTGEVPGSADISNVTVAESGGTITFQAATNLSDWQPNTFFAVLVDSDQNAATGTSGFDYILTGDHYGGTVVNTASHVVVPASSSLSAGVWTVTVQASQIGNPRAFSFFVLTQTGPDPRFPYQDRAPDTGLYTYPAAPPPPPPPTPEPAPPKVSSVAATYAGVPVHGKAFRVMRLDIGLSDGTSTVAVDLTCKATLAGRALPGNACSFRLPRSSKGKRFVVKVTGLYGNASVAKTYAFRVR